MFCRIPSRGARGRGRTRRAQTRARRRTERYVEHARQAQRRHRAPQRTAAGIRQNIRAQKKRLGNFHDGLPTRSADSLQLFSFPGPSPTLADQHASRFPSEPSTTANSLVFWPGNLPRRRHSSGTLETCQQLFRRRRENRRAGRKNHRWTVSHPLRTSGPGRRRGTRGRGSDSRSPHHQGDV